MASDGEPVVPTGEVEPMFGDVSLNNNAGTEPHTTLPPLLGTQQLEEIELHLSHRIGRHGVLVARRNVKEDIADRSPSLPDARHIQLEFEVIRVGPRQGEGLGAGRKSNHSGLEGRRRLRSFSEDNDLKVLFIRLYLLK